MEKNVGINNFRQLFDLNKEYVNFKSSFKVTALDGGPFYIAVTDQNTLDNGDIEFKEVEGESSGNLTSDKNISQIYYLALKSDEPREVSINIQIEELPLKKLEYSPEEEPNTVKTTDKQQSKFNTDFVVKILLMVLVLVAIIFILYKFIFDKKSKKKISPPAGFSYNESFYE